MSIILTKSQLDILNDHSGVRYVDDVNICLTSGLVTRLYEAWVIAPSYETICSEMNDASLKLDDLGISISRYLDFFFIREGKPVEDKLIPLDERKLLKGRKPLDGPGYVDVLLHTGKFVKRTKGIGLEESLEETLFKAYPEQSLEEGLRSAGIDPRIVGRERMSRISKRFDRMLEAEECPCKGAHEYTQEAIRRYSSHPYISSIKREELVMRDAFYQDAASICELPIRQILSVFELEPGLFTVRELDVLQAKISSWTGTDTEPVSSSETTVKILCHRMEALQEVQDLRWKALGDSIPRLSLTDKREVFSNIASFIQKLGIPGELNRVLRLIGIPRSTFYGCLANEEYGEARRRKEIQDEEDGAKVRMVFEYKGFKKGARMVQMMLPGLAGVDFSLKKVRRLMKKFGMECGVRAPNDAKAKSREFLSTHVKKDLLKRRFRLGRPNKYRLTDVTYLDFGKPDDNGKRLRAYGSAMIDSVTGRLIVMNISMKNDVDLVMETLRLSKEYPWVEGGMIHSDQGVVYLSDTFQKEVREMGLEQSMSKRGNCLDNSPMESFFGHFKDEADYSSCSTFEELEILIGSYQEYYNNERPMAGRLGMTPVQYEEYLLSMDEEEFADYLLGEEKKYSEMKTRAKELAIEKAKTLGVDGVKEGA